MNAPNFNFIAPFYDLLSLIFFLGGRGLKKAQQVHVQNIKSNDKVLILGGGTGEILAWLPNDCEVIYLELSAAMIHRAKRRGSAHFVQADFFTCSINQRFDWIICPFFLDCFDEENLKEALEKIHHFMKKNGRVIITDFSSVCWRHKLIVVSMICFFRLTANLQATRLLPIHSLVLQADFMQDEGCFFREGFIFSAMYRKKKPFGC